MNLRQFFNDIAGLAADRWPLAEDSSSVNPIIQAIARPIGVARGGRKCMLLSDGKSAFL